MAALLALTLATGAASSSSPGLSLAAFPELTDRAFLQSLISRADAADAEDVDAAAAPEMPTSFHGTLLLINNEGGNNTTLIGDAYVSGPAGIVRMAGLYNAQTPGGEATVGANWLYALKQSLLGISSATSTNTFIMNDPVTENPVCRITRMSDSAIAATQPAVAIPLGFHYLGTVLTRGSLTFSPGKSSLLFIDAFSSSPVAIVDAYTNSDDISVGLYGNVAPGAVAPYLVAPPAGMQCDLTQGGSRTPISARSEALLARMLGAAQSGSK